MGGWVIPERTILRSLYKHAQLANLPERGSRVPKKNEKSNNQRQLSSGDEKQISFHWLPKSLEFLDGALEAEFVLSAAELAAALLGHQPPDPWLHPTRATLDVKHNIKKLNFKVFMLSIS